jgi:hypothetical protein
MFIGGLVEVADWSAREQDAFKAPTARSKGKIFLKRVFMSADVSDGKWKTLHHFSSIHLRFVQMVAGLQFGEALKMFRSQRFGNDVFAAEPFTEIHQLATLRTKRPELSGKPVAGLAAGWAFRQPPGIIWFPLQSP